MIDSMDFLNSQDTKELFRAILSLKNEEECRKFFRDLLTEAEIKEFVNRWKVVRLLDKQIPYETITKQTGMSSTTIARIAKWMHGTMGGYTFMLKRTKQNKVTNHHTPSSAE